MIKRKISTVCKYANMSTTQIKLPYRGIVVRAPQDLQVPQVVALYLDVKM